MGIVIISTYPDKKSVEKIADAVVAKRLAACVNYTEIKSVYSWKGKMEKAGEVLAFFKTTAKARDMLKKEIARTHPYDVPEIAELKMASVNTSYQKWLEDSTRNRKPKKRNNPSKR